MQTKNDTISVIFKEKDWFSWGNFPDLFPHLHKDLIYDTLKKMCLGLVLGETVKPEIVNLN